jgi:flagellar motility protein MotE (MotC chaperone)
VNFKGLLHKLLTWSVYTAAVLFLAAAAALLALCATKRLDRERAGAVWGILCGERVAVTPQDRIDLKDFRTKAEARAKSKVQQDEDSASGSAQRILDAERERLSDQRRKEQLELEELSKLLAEREKRYQADRNQFQAAQLAFQDQQKKFNDARRDESLRKVLKLYAGMEADLIAGDIEDRLKGGDQAIPELVEILLRMPERQASEVLAAMVKPENRNKLMEALKK